MKSLIVRFLFTLCIPVFLFYFYEREVNSRLPSSDPKFHKIVVFYSSVGAGHISAANAIKESILAKEPNAIIEMKNIRDFHVKGEKGAKRSEKLFWFIVKNYPDFFDKLYKGKMERGNLQPILSEAEKSYDLVGLRNYILNENPTSILSTHYGSTVSLSGLREQGLLRDVNIGWLHTDYIKGFFPRISQNIERTFLPINDLEQVWLDSGVPKEKVEVSGMPVNPALYEEFNREEFLIQEGLDPNVRTITMATGGEGVGDFPKIVERLTQSMGKPIQIIAICGKSKKNLDGLNAMKLPEGVTLKAEGFIPIDRAISFYKSADLYITKSGGLSPAEGFAIGKPIVLLDIYGGHERENAELFEKLGLAVINRDIDKIGEEASELMADPDKIKQMKKAQRNFANSIQISKIVDFTLDEGQIDNSFRQFTLGVERGREVKGSLEAIQKLDKFYPGEVEILLSYAKSVTGQYLERGGNPFGHLAIRVGDFVYTANGKARPGSDEKLLIKTPLKDYLYGVQRVTTNQEMTDSYGSAYGRDVLTLRLDGVEKEKVQKMVNYADGVNEKWLKGEAFWHRSECNCADHVVNILKAGGIDTPEKKKFTMPLDVFRYYVKHFEGVPGIQAHIHYISKIVGSKNAYRFSNFPLSIYSFGNALKRVYKNWRGKATLDPLELKVKSRIASYPGLDSVVFEEQAQGEAQRTARAKNESRIREARNRRGTIQQRVVELEGEIALLSDDIERNNGSQNVLSRVKEVITEGSDEAISRDPEIRKWLEENKKLQGMIDELNLLQADLVTDTILTTTESHFRQIHGSLNPKLVAKLEASLQKIRDSYDKHLDFKELYGQAKDTKRIGAIKEIMLEGKVFYDFLEQAERRSKKVGFKRKIKMIMASIPNRLKKVLEFLRTLPSTLRFLGSLFVVENVAKKGKSSFISATHDFFKSKANAGGYEVATVGRENIPSSTNPKSVVIYMPTHRNPITDGFHMAELGVDDALLFAAPDQFAPKVLADQAQKQSNVIFVGRGSGKPVEQMMEQLEKGESRNIFIYPEGSTSTFLETRPVRKNFYHSMLKSLHEAGYEINLVPITYEQDENILGSVKVKKVKKLKSTIHKSLDPKVTAALLEEGKYEELTRTIIRSIWLDQLATDETYLNGQMRTRSIMGQLERYMRSVRGEVRRFFRNDCSALLKTITYQL